MRRVVTHELDAPPEAVFEWVAALERYPAWMPLVTRAAREADADPPAWAVELTGRLGPLARSKRLRMVRSLLEPAHRVRFERDERDGRRHSPWILEAAVEPTATGSRLAMELHYGGSLFGPVLERVLADQVDEGRARLGALVSGGPPGAAGASR